MRYTSLLYVAVIKFVIFKKIYIILHIIYKIYIINLLKTSVCYCYSYVIRHFKVVYDEVAFLLHFQNDT